MFDLDSLENSYQSCPDFDGGTILDATDFARLRTLNLQALNSLILEVSHELYQPEASDYEARASVVSLINLGLLSRDHIYGNRQYA